MPRINSLNTFVISSIINSAGAVDPEQANYQGATMLFVLNGTAPTGWVKDTSDTDYTLRCVTGSALSGGTSNFSTVMAPKSIVGSVPVTGTVGPTTLTTSQMGTHSHSAGTTYIASVVTNILRTGTPATSMEAPTTGYYTGSLQDSPTGPGLVGGTAHTHPNASPGVTNPTTLATVNLTVKYVDSILATRT
jgi:hypothetical protein